MVDINFINEGYKQKGDVCALASYSIIIEHYSRRVVKMQSVFSNFVSYFPDLNKKITKVLNKTHANERSKVKENLISMEFHNYCKSANDKRGFDFFVELHNANALNTRCYCHVIKSKALKSENIDVNEVAIIRENLKSGGLAMVLFFTSEDAHSIVVGYDKDKNEYFKSDTNARKIEYEDFLDLNMICEYIWFSNDARIIDEYNSQVIPIQ